MTMDANPFMRGLRQAEGAASRFAGGMKTIMGPVLGMFGVTGAASMVYGIKRMVDEMDHLLDLSRKSGANFEGFQRVSQTFVEAGSSAEQLATTMGKVEKSTGSALSGSKAFTDAFARLNIKLAEFSRAEPTEKILRLADAWATGAKSGEDVVAMTTIMGRSFSDMRQSMDAGRAGIVATGESINVMSETSVKALANLNDEWDRIKRNFMVGGGKHVLSLIRTLQGAWQTAGEMRTSDFTHNFQNSANDAEFPWTLAQRRISSQAQAESHRSMLSELQSQYRGGLGQFMEASNNGEDTRLLSKTLEELRDQIRQMNSNDPVTEH